MFQYHKQFNMSLPLDQQFTLVACASLRILWLDHFLLVLCDVTPQ